MRVNTVTVTSNEFDIMYLAIVESQKCAPAGCKYDNAIEAISAQIDAYPDANFLRAQEYIQYFEENCFDLSMF